MTVGVFLDLDGVITPQAVNLQFANMLSVGSALQELEDRYSNGEINNEQFNDVFVPLFREAGFTSKFAREKFSNILLSSWAEELVQVNLPDTFIVSSSPSYYVEQFARKYGIPTANVLCSKYDFDGEDLLLSCVSSAGVAQKAEFVSRRADKYAVSIAVGDSPEQDSRFMSHCTLKILLGGERRNYLHSVDLNPIHSLVQLIRKLESGNTSVVPGACVDGVARLQSEGPLERSVFIIVPFRSDARFGAAIQAIRDALAAGGYIGWTAADLELDGDLWNNVRCFMYGCKRAVALVTADEKKDGDNTIVRKDVYNPNVIAEAGFMLGQGKQLLLLTDDRIRLPTDWLGKLFKPINLTNPAAEVQKSVRDWMLNWVD